MYAEADLLPLSGLQHLAFCERQWALIHIEQQWEENQATAEGRLLHAKADDGLVETRSGVRIVRALPLRSFRLGLSAKADVIEFPLDGGLPVPIEYKRGRPKRGDWDEVQLCAQALCLEEMMPVEVPEGAIFYASTRRRTPVPFTPALRAETERLANRMHQMHALRVTPPPIYLPHCKSCSLIEICQPNALVNRGSARTFFRRTIKSALSDSEP